MVVVSSPRPVHKVFFSDLLPKRCPLLFQSITEALKENDIAFGLLTKTKDIWCRDYMPVRITEDRYVFYRYNPDYLQSPYYRRTITKLESVDIINTIPWQKCTILDLVVDGGNVVRCGDKVVMTEKVFVENSDKSRVDVVHKLEEAFRCEVVFLPWDRKEILGHSDGIIHYIDGNRVLMTNYYDFSPYFYRRFRKALDTHFEVTPLRFDVKCKHSRSWAYINFLKLDGLVLVPQLGIPEDEQALQQIAAAIPESKVVGIPSIEAVRRGGALNCITWDVIV